MEPLVYNQSSFLGGFNRQYDPTRIQRDSYPLLVNGRVRDDVILPITKPLRDASGLPASYTKIQGLYAADKFSLVFIDGLAYIKDYSLTGSSYVLLSGFQMSADVDIIYTELVPTSSINLARKAVSAAAANAGVNLITPLEASPACVVCQDGINQPRLIFTDGTVRISKNWNQWTESDREYVPIGKQMFYSPNAVLYVVASNGKSLYRSVTGRPLDFIIAVDTNGVKLPTEAESGAAVLSHAVSFDEITAIRKTNSNDGQFIVSTLKNTWLVQPLFDDLIYGEPKFSNQFLFDTGAINQFSLCELRGDTALVDTNSIRSFNAVLNSRNEGKNEPFSRRINSLFEGVSQPLTCCSFAFDNYTLFGVQTIYGAAVVVYDNQTNQFIGFDQYDGVEQVKQFAEIKVGTMRKLLFVTTDNRIYEFETGSTKETASFYSGEFISGDPKIHQKPDKINVVFLDPKESGIVYAYVYVDGKQQLALKSVIKEAVPVDVIPLAIPFGSSSVDRVKTLTYDCTSSAAGWKIGVMFSWNFDAKLSNIRIQAIKETQNVNYEQQAVDFARYSAATEIVLDSFTPTSGVLGTLVDIFGVGFTNVTNVLINGTSCEFIVINDNHISITVPSGASTGKIKLVSLYDELESETDFTIN